MTWITNCSMADVINGTHKFVKGNTYLIQIQDFGAWQFAVPKKSFVGVTQLKFDDHDNPFLASNISDEQAQIIGEVLKNCLEKKINVLVHCHAGICRSGAVTEVGVLLGFDDLGVHRIPNVLVKSKVRKSVGIKLSWEI